MKCEFKKLQWKLNIKVETKSEAMANLRLDQANGARPGQARLNSMP